MGGPDRYWKTTINPYNQVFALTQHIINQGISNLYTRLETGEEGVPIPKPIRVNSDEHNFIRNVVFGPPKVIVQSDYTNLKSVNFKMHLKSGDIQLRSYIETTEDGDIRAEKLNLTINDWYVTVPVDTGFVVVDQTTTRGKSIVARSAAKGKVNHSIHELLLDLTSMAMANCVWELGVYHENDLFTDVNGNTGKPKGWVEGQPRNLDGISTDFRNMMDFFIQKASQTLTTRNLNSMGFAVMAPDANSRENFETTDVRYQTYPWTYPDSGQKAAPGLSGDGRLNYLLYLETVDGNKVPKASDPASALSSRMGNWTTGRDPGTDSPTAFGTYVLSSEMFMEKLLIPKLSCINRVMAVDITDVAASASMNWAAIVHYTVSANWRIGAGDVNKEVTEFLLQKSTVLAINDSWQDDAKTWLRPLTISPGEGSNVWAYQDIEWGSTAKHAPRASSGLYDVDNSGDTITFTRVFTAAGSNKIVYEGRTWTKLEYCVDPPIGYKERGYMYGKAKWSITFTLSEVTDGGMKIKIDTEEPTVDVTADGMWAQNDNSYAKCMKSGYAIAHSNFEYFLGTIRNSLEGQEKFTLPASGVFYFKNPVINFKGDLVCDLEYNGNPKLANVNKGTEEERMRLPQGEYTNMPGATSFGGGGQGKKE